MPSSQGKVSATFVIAELQKLRVRELPVLLRVVGREIIMLLIREGAMNINGRVLKKNGPNAALARYYTATMTAEIDAQSGRMVTGLPEADLNGRILAHRETGGTITMKDKHLRIPLPPALLPSGFEHADTHGINLKARMVAGDNKFFVFKAKTGNVFLAKQRENAAKGEAPELFFLLRSQVTQKPHPWFSNAVATVQQAVPSIVEKHRQRILEAGKTEGA